MGANIHKKTESPKLSVNYLRKLLFALEYSRIFAQMPEVLHGDIEDQIRIARYGLRGTAAIAGGADKGYECASGRRRAYSSGPCQIR